MYRCKVQLLADAAAAVRGIYTKKIPEADAELTFKTIGSSFSGWFSGLLEFQLLEAREGQKFESGLKPQC